MADTNNGGKAFPVTAGNTVYSGGMSMRDWFAGQALVGIITNPPGLVGGDPEIAALKAYQYADAMLEARK